jgi:hypothetical protein
MLSGMPRGFCKQSTRLTMDTVQMEMVEKWLATFVTMLLRLRIPASPAALAI